MMSMKTSKKKISAYIAAPLFNDMERAFNCTLAKSLERCVDVFLPQRDGGLMMELVKRGVPPDEAAKSVFEMDLQAMEKADVLVAVLDGANIDEGVAFEIGYMFAMKKYCLGYQTDMRRSLPTGNNPMIAASLNMVCANVASLLSAIEAHLEALNEPRIPQHFAHSLTRELD
jgi:nucleoside 2-deoxyribosyltransferase